ncbi:transcription antiterminator [Coprobacillus sp. AF36-10BH]|nr:transcription antiterminator [Coprobacillus sp. AF36-10BH]
MQLKKNEIKIIQLLLASDNYISSYEIANSTGISRRRVRDEMKIVKDIFASLHLNLLSKTSKGYYIEGKSSQDLTELQNIINNTEREDSSLIPSLPDERSSYILGRLINSKEYIKLETLADELLVSRATIANDLISIKKEFKKYGLKFNQKPNYGIYIGGSEIGKRKCLVDNIFRNLNVSDMYFDFLDTYFNSPDYEIIQILREYAISISDISLIDFLISFSISAARVSCGYLIEQETEDFQNFQNRTEYSAAKKLALYAEEHLDVEFNDYEIQNITIQLICKRSTKGLTFINDQNIIDLKDEILNEIEKKTLITFEDDHFEKVFPLYLKYTLIRQKYGEKIRTPLYEDIQYDYPLSYYLAQIVSQVIKKHTKIALSRSEITNFTILFNNTINNKKYSQKKVLLINCMSESIKTFIDHFVEKELYNQLVITKSIHYYEIEEENLNQYDLILSTSPIHRQLPIPVISVNYIMSQDDIIRIKSYLSYLFNDKQMLYYFHPSFYKTHVQVKTLKGLATNFYQLIKTVYHLNDSKKNDIMNKNICSIHTFENSIGLLRLTRPLNSNNIISIVTLEEPITIENQTFNIAILFSCTDNQNIMYNTLFSTLKNISKNKDYLNRLSSHISYTEFLSIILKNK